MCPVSPTTNLTGGNCEEDLAVRSRRRHHELISRKSDFPELVGRRRHRTSVCKKKGRRGGPEKVISQINHIFLNSFGEDDVLLASGEKYSLVQQPRASPRSATHDGSPEASKFSPRRHIHHAHRRSQYGERHSRFLPQFQRVREQGIPPSFQEFSNASEDNQHHARP